MLWPEQVIRRTELLEKVWDSLSEPDSNVVDVHIRNLRRKLSEAGESTALETVRSVGFVLK
jgi:two-component system OmpR family response regulator